MAIDPNTTMGYVHLTVSALDRSLAFYQQNLGFKLHQREGQTARLGAGGPDLLWLTEQAGARTVAGVTGLYHFAILVPSRLALAQSLRQLAETRTPVQGFADHHVSEAIYLADPDGNGIEIYRDRPRTEWRWSDGQLHMTTDPLDIEGILAELAETPEPWSGLPAQTVLGHMHLHVADIAKAEAFYGDVLGFELTTRYGASASFFSAGGYHHHLAFNTWAGRGAPPPPPDAVGLRYFTINLPDQAELDRVAGRIKQAGIEVKEKEAALFVRDPSHNGMILVGGPMSEVPAELTTGT